MNRRIPNGTYGGVRGRKFKTSSYSIVISFYTREFYALHHLIQRILFQERHDE